MHITEKVGNLVANNANAKQAFVLSVISPTAIP